MKILKGTHNGSELYRIDAEKYAIHFHAQGNVVLSS